MNGYERREKHKLAVLRRAHKTYCKHLDRVIEGARREIHVYACGLKDREPSPLLLTLLHNLEIAVTARAACLEFNTIRMRPVEPQRED